MLLISYSAPPPAEADLPVMKQDHWCEIKYCATIWIVSNPSASGNKGTVLKNETTKALEAHSYCLRSTHRLIGSASIDWLSWFYKWAGQVYGTLLKTESVAGSGC